MKKKTVSQLKKSLDKLFSIYIRLRDSKNGICTCYTCGTRNEWKYMQNGHFVSRGKMATRYDEENCHCQCMSCNVFRNGNYPIYAERLISQYGPDVIKKLNKKGNQIKQFRTTELEEMIELYKKKIKALDK